MNRRSFFKAVTGFVAGAIVVFTPKAKAKKKLIPKSEPPMGLYKELQFGESFEEKIVSMTTFQGELWIATEKGVYKIVNVREI